MSSVDERVVRMSFDNAEFEKKASTTMSTLAKLKENLNFSGVLKGVGEIQNGISNVKFDALSNSISAIESRFSVFGEFIHNTLLGMVNNAVDAGKRMAEALTITPAKEGFAEYELKMGSIQTIMASTGESLETVNARLDELNEYADKTIYSFSDMTNNIGKFTNAGVKLDDAVAAIQGISNVAAISGANTQQASHAMYNFAQALSAGAVKLQDWKSIETANMSTVEFRQSLLDTAEAMGTVVKVGDQYQTTTTNLQGKISELFEVTKGFNGSLAHQWLTDEVLVRTLNNYATDIRDLDDAEKEAFITQLKSIGYTDEQIERIKELGQKAADSAKDVKTFTQLIDTLKEALGTGWATTWENVIGNFEEAKALWTEVSDTLTTFINKSSDARNALVKSWKDLGGREALIQSFRNGFEAFLSIMTPISQAFKSVFPAVTAERLVEYTEKLRDFTAGLKLTITQSGILKATAQIVFTILKSAFEAIYNIGKDVFNIIKAIGSGLVDAFNISTLTSIQQFVDSFKQFVDTIKPSENTLQNLKRLGEGIGSVFRALITIASNLGTALFGSLGTFFTDSAPDIEHFMDSLGNIGDKLKSFAFELENAFSVDNLSGGVGKLGEILSNLFGIIKSNVDIPSILQKIFDYITGIDLSGISGFFNGVLDGAKGISDIIQNIFTNLGGENGFFAWLVNGFKSIISKIDWSILFEILSHIENYITAKSLLKLVDWLKKLPESISGVLKEFKEVKELAKSDPGVFARIFDEIGNSLERWQKTLKSVSLLAIAAAIALIAHAVFELAQVPVDKIIPAFGALAGGIALLVGAIKLIKNQDIADLSMAFSLAWVLDMLANSIVKLASLEPARMTSGLIGVVVLLGAVVAALKALDGIKNLNTKNLIAFSAAILIIGLAIRLLAGSVKKLAKLDPGQLATGLVGVIVLMGSLVAAIDYLGSRKIKNAGNIAALAAAMILISLAVGMLVGSVKKLAKLDPMGLILGLSGVIILMGALVGILNYMSGIDMSHAGSMVALSAAMILIATAVGMLASSVKKLAKLDPGNLAAGLGSVILLLGSLAATIEYMSKKVKFDNVAGITALSACMILIAEAVSILAKSVVKMGSLSLDQMAIGLLGVAAPLAALIVAIQALSSIDQTKIAGIAALAATMVVLSIAIKLLSSSVIALGSLNLGELAIGLIGMVGSLFALVGAMYALSNLPTTDLMGASAAMLAMAVSMAILAPAIVMLSTMDIGGLVIALVALGGAFMLFAGIATASALTSAALLTFAGAIALVGVGILALASGIGIISKIIATAGPEIGAGIQVILQTIIDTLPLMGETLLTFLTTMWDVLMNFIAEAVPKLFETLTVLFQSLCEFLITNFPTLLTTLFTLLTDLGKAVLEFGPEMFNIGIQIIVSFLKAIGENFPTIFNAAFDLLGQFFQGILGRLPDIVRGAFEIVIGFINGLADAIRENHMALFEAIGNLIDAIVHAIIDGVVMVGKAAADWITGPGGILDSIGSFFTDLYNQGVNLVQGFIDGLTSAPGAIWDAACGLANQALNAIGITLDEHSPSKKTFKNGQYFVEGFVNGIKNMNHSAIAEAGAVAYATLSALEDGLNSGNVEFNPTITPVVDASEIQNGVKSINGSIGSIPDAVNISSTIRNDKALQRQMIDVMGAGNDYSDILSGMNDLKQTLNGYNELLSNLRVVMDSGALVGAIVPQMDSALGMRQVMAGRGVY